MIRTYLLRAAAALWLCTAASAADTAADPVVAERGPIQLTAHQARALVAGTDADLRRKLSTDPAALRIFLRDVLLQQALLADAHAQKWDQRSEVAASVQRARDQVVAQSFLAAQAPLPAGYPSDADIQAAYVQNKAQLMQPRTYHLSEIFIPAAALHGDDGRRRLADLRARLLHGHGNFETAAGGTADAHYAELGFLPETSLIPAVRSAVAGLLEGAISEPVCSTGGCSVLRLLATRPAGPAPLSDVRERIARALRQQRTAQGEQAYANSLLERQPVRLNDIELAHLVDPPPHPSASDPAVGRH